MNTNLDKEVKELLDLYRDIEKTEYSYDHSLLYVSSKLSQLIKKGLKLSDLNEDQQKKFNELSWQWGMSSISIQKTQNNLIDLQKKFRNDDQIMKEDISNSIDECDHEGCTKPVKWVVKKHFFCTEHCGLKWWQKAWGYLHGFSQFWLYFNRK